MTVGKKRQIASILGIASIISIGLYVSPIVAKSNVDDVLAKYQETTIDAVQKLNSAHYSAVPLDDELSARLLDKYMDSLDPTRSYFLQSDVDSLQSYNSVLDNQLESGEVSAAFTIYKLYHERVNARLSATMVNLAAMIDGFDFTQNESMPRDSEDLSWPVDMAEADDRWRKRIKNDVLNLKLAKKTNAEILELLTKRYEYRLKRFDQLNEDDIYAIFMNTYAEMYDPHTSYFSPRQMENFRINMSRSLEGIGAVLTQEYEHTKIVRLVSGGPANRQTDLKTADRILAVGQGTEGEMVNVVGWRLDEVVDLIRGDKETWVRLEVLPAKADLSGITKIISIQRGKVELEDQLAKAEVIEVFHNDALHKIGVINIPDFYADFDGMRDGDPNYRSTTRDTAKLLEELQAQDVEGIVIDLRENAGGSLAEANSLVGLFIQSGPTVQIRSSNNRVQRQGKSRPSSYYDGPLLVLINRLSASASEIFAGAIQDYGRGVVAGNTTFGKGTVQGLLPLPEGQLKMTGSKFYRVSGQSTQNKGVEPDVVFPTLYDPEEIGESALKGALPWDTINPAPHARYLDISSMRDELNRRSTARAAADPDLVYLHDQYELAAEYRKISEISLNESVRLNQRTDGDARLLAIENKRLLAKGLDPLDKLAEDDADESADPEAGILPEEPGEEAKLEDDAIAVEAVRVLIDSMALAPRVAKAATAGNP